MIALFGFAILGMRAKLIKGQRLDAEDVFFAGLKTHLQVR
jgi:hypothetical protein